MISRATLLLALCAGWAVAGGAIPAGIPNSQIPVLSQPATTECPSATTPGHIRALGG
ncbi:MAG: hypothetical protein M1376_16525 [Planctomycetes bacterium]|nr:hypothetical protein [Planctomycetota bacterium]